MYFSSICKLAETVETYGDAGSNIRIELAKLFLQRIGVKASDLLEKRKARWEHLHEKIKSYQNIWDGNSYVNDKIKAIKYLRTEAQKEVKFKLGLKYAKDYVEWVWGCPGTSEPVFEEIPF